ncbi:MAG TPA: hypothetical protein VH680_01260 [Gemmatimonadales bacterium]|jgi:hypothetical protein
MLLCHCRRLRLGRADDLPRFSGGNPAAKIRLLAGGLGADSIGSRFEVRPRLGRFD